VPFNNQAYLYTGGHVIYIVPFNNQAYLYTGGHVIIKKTAEQPP